MVLNYPIDLLRDKSGFFTEKGLTKQFEKNWRTVVGHTLDINFHLKDRQVLRLRFEYFPTTEGQALSIRIDGKPLDATVLGTKGIFWKDFSAGNHKIEFYFTKVRSSEEVKNDPRPLSAAFTQLTIENMQPSYNGNQWLFGIILLFCLACLFLLLRPYHCRQI